LLYNLEAIQAYGAKVQKDVGSGQTDLFGAMGEAGAVPEPEIKPAPTQFSTKEQLLWERDLMGLYLSAHPLDKYDTYFEEQTHPLSLITAENNNKIITVGGIITAVRTILTKSNTKMAFVKIENKGGETEIICFPSIFESYGGKLVVDNVIKVVGKVNATDRDGNITNEVKVMAESVEVISDEMLENYVSTGQKLPAPVDAPKGNRRGGGRRSSSSAERVYTGARKPAPVSDEPHHVITEPPKDPRKERVFILIENPNDTETLSALRRLCDINLGFQDVILVLEEKGEKKPLKMPFKVDASDDFLAKLKELIGEDKVKLK
jgi:DNA polymerase-3 subunit alpha